MHTCSLLLICLDCNLRYAVLSLKGSIIIFEKLRRIMIQLNTCTQNTSTNTPTNSLHIFSTVLTNSLTLIRFLPGFLRYVLLSLFLP